MEPSADMQRPGLPDLAGLELSDIDDLPQAGLRASVRALLLRMEDGQEPLYSFNANI
ncbi:hypothetical protein [Streptomyces sp. NBC_01198]|uniref:hypothetical protein n=1 Tax=Streptomyces sp. NBC_01198 TaxID=2903769 RepID=UPI002E1490FC|nr:hypothetical protein OG702_00725 [Streptomyces sp. NBC_01198]